MTDAQPLVTAAEVRKMVRVPGAWSDADLGGLIRRAEARIRRYCRWHVWPVLGQEVWAQSDGSESILLRSLRVVDVESVSIGGLRVERDRLDWSEDGRLRLVGRRFPDSLRAIRVSFTHGWDPEDVADVQDVLLGMLERTLSVPVGVKSSSTGDKSVEYAIESSLRPTVGDRQVLDEYRIAR